MSLELQATFKNKVLAGIDDLPSFSPAVQEVIVISNDLSSSPKDLMKVIKTDPVLTAKILKLVNSSYFSLNSEVASLNRALVLLGFNTIKNIAISTEMVKLSDSAGHNPHFKYRELWEHMLAVGAVGKYIARESGEERKLLEEYFIAGLIHDIGDFLMMRFLPEQYHKIKIYATEKAMPLRDCARSVLGFSSGEMGVKLADRWKLQKRLQDVIEMMEHGKGNEKLQKVILLSDKFCRSKEIGYVCDQSDIVIDPADLKAVGLDAAFFEEHEEMILEEVEKAKILIA